MAKTMWNALFLLYASTLAMGLGYNPQEDLGKDLSSITTEFSPHPPESTIVGIQWQHYQNWYVTATVIAPNYIITAAHWNTVDRADPNWPIGYRIKKQGGKQLNGGEYIIVDARGPFNNVKKLQGGTPKPDLMICRVKRTEPADPNPAPEEYASLKDANFPVRIWFYEGNGEVGQVMTTGSFGKIEASIKTWCDSDKTERETIPQIRIPGTLHWGRNMIIRADNNYISCNYDGVGSANYIQYECYGAYGSSGAPWFIQDKKGDWRLAGLFTDCTSGPRISQWIRWINQQILDMEGYSDSRTSKGKTP